jgi:hypothetical protein
MVEYGPESPSSDWGILTGPCKHNNEMSRSIKFWEFIDWLKNCLWSQEGCSSMEFINWCTAILPNEFFYHSTEQNRPATHKSPFSLVDVGHRLTDTLNSLLYKNLTSIYNSDFAAWHTIGWSTAWSQANAFRKPSRCVFSRNLYAVQRFLTLLCKL